MRAIAFLILSFLACKAFAQYHVNGCRSPHLDGEICIIKNSVKSERFSSSDLMALKQYIAAHPGLPWLQLIDPKKKLLKELQAMTGKILQSERALYNDLLSQLKMRMEADKAVHAVSIFVKSQPNYSFYLNSKDKFLMRRFVPVLTPGSSHSEISDINYRHCAPDIKKFNAIMKERGRCSNLEESKNSFNLYHALAELAACGEYAIQNINAQESSKTERDSETADCLVRLNNISASVGRGAVEIKTGGKTLRLDWSAGHDLSGIKNDISYWRDQLEPQMIKALKSSPVAEKNSPAEN